MSTRYRNPFKIRATEKLETENNFLRMYSPFVLEELVEKNRSGKLWNNVLFIRSSPGAGKTSILKVLEPASLLTLSNNKSSLYYKDTIEYLKKLDVIDENFGINICSVYMSCARNYEVIEDLNLSDGNKKSMFFGLINARIILATLRSILSLNTNSELTDITVNGSSFDYSFLDIKLPITGNELFEWSANIEKSVFKAIDSFLPITNVQHNYAELFAFDLMQPANISIKGTAMSGRILFMFDDAHNLSKNQRESLLDYLTVRRANYNIWISERLEALDEQRNFGSFKNRDYDEINLEEIWQGNNKLKNIVANIAEKRASISSEEVKSFQDYLDNNINEAELEEKFIKSYNQSTENIVNISKYSPKFDIWIEYLKAQRSLLTPFQYALLLRQAEILINRNIGKPQMSFEFTLPLDELKQKLGAEIQSTALFFLSIENKIPFYYGFDNLVKLSSNNIEQFLSFASDLFEIMLARKISDKPINVGASEQERLLKRIADNKWNELTRLVPYSDNVHRFLHNLAQFSQKETSKPNAPYAPGINGFAIREQSESSLVDSGNWRDDKTYEPLTQVLRTCISYNLLEKRLTKQGKENQVHTVYYLNRWICLRFNLPFSYGGFRHRYPGELLKWVKQI